MKDFDRTISEAFSHKINPSQSVNNVILQYRKGDLKMKRKIDFRKVVAAVCIMVLSSVTVYRAAKFLQPSQVAEKTGDFTLTAAFEGESAVIINETQQSGGYNITLMGIVSGQDISENIRTTDNNLNPGSTYCVVAVEKADGTKFGDIMETPTLFVSPYIKGFHPNIVNVASLNGGYFDIVEDGIMYRLMDCDNIEIFASTKVYLGVSEGMLLSGKAFIYNEKDGNLSKNPEFNGINALFELPLDTAKANPEKATEILMSIVG